MRTRATVIGLLLIAALGGRAARAHVDVDTLGGPDPFFQDDVGGSSAGTDRTAAAVAPTSAPAVHPVLLRGYLYGMGGLAVIVAVLLVRSGGMRLYGFSTGPADHSPPQVPEDRATK